MTTTAQAQILHQHSKPDTKRLWQLDQRHSTFAMRRTMAYITIISEESAEPMTLHPWQQSESSKVKGERRV